MQNKTIVLISLAIALFTSPIIYMHSSERMGSDDAAKQMIQEINPDYEPWASSLWEPSDNLETAFFILQAGLGAGFIGYFFGKRRRSRKQNNRSNA